MESLHPLNHQCPAGDHKALEASLYPVHHRKLPQPHWKGPVLLCHLSALPETSHPHPHLQRQ
ncbi:Uncharacterised protein [Chlamydia abortus]|nr:Uncharacterised protein [Chlamydia abortus]